MNLMQMLSLILEAGVVVIGLALGIAKKKLYGWLIALTFAIYVLYDLARFMPFGLSAGALDALFAIASLSIFAAVLGVYSHAQ